MLTRPDMIEPVITVAAAPESVSIATAARMLGVSERLVSDLIATGELPSFKIRNRRLVAVQAIRSFVADAADQHDK